MTINSMSDLDQNLGLPRNPRPTKEQIKAVLQATMAVAETVREFTREQGYCQAGPVYTALMEKGATIEDYQAIISSLGRAGLVEDRGERLIWIGPNLETNDG